MVDQVNSVFLIEHNLDVLKAADYVIEIGPGGGLMGGEILIVVLPRSYYPASVPLRKTILFDDWRILWERDYTLRLYVNIRQR